MLEACGCFVQWMVLSIGTCVEESADSAPTPFSSAPFIEEQIIFTLTLYDLRQVDYVCNLVHCH